MREPPQASERLCRATVVRDMIPQGIPWQGAPKVMSWELSRTLIIWGVFADLCFDPPTGHCLLTFLKFPRSMLALLRSAHGKIRNRVRLETTAIISKLSRGKVSRGKRQTNIWDVMTREHRRPVVSAARKALRFGARIIFFPDLFCRWRMGTTNVVRSSDSWQWMAWHVGISEECPQR